jgi:hypothetical protein
MRPKSKAAYNGLAGDWREDWLPAAYMGLLAIGAKIDAKIGERIGTRRHT